MCDKIPLWFWLRWLSSQHTYDQKVNTWKMVLLTFDYHPVHNWKENNKIHEYFLTISGVSCNFLNLYSQNCCFNGILAFWSHKNCRGKFLQCTYLNMGNLCLSVKSSALNTHPVVQAVLVSKWDWMRPHILTWSLPV